MGNPHTPERPLSLMSADSIRSVAKAVRDRADNASGLEAALLDCTNEATAVLLTLTDNCIAFTPWYLQPLEDAIQRVFENL
jgi:hypothetical protein